MASKSMVERVARAVAECDKDFRPVFRAPLLATSGEWKVSVDGTQLLPVSFPVLQKQKPVRGHE